MPSDNCYGDGPTGMLRYTQEGPKPSCEAYPQKMIVMLSFEGQKVICQTMEIRGRGKTIPGRGKGMLMDQRRGWGVHVCIVYMGDCKDRASDTESSRGNSREMRTRKASIPYS